MLQRLLLAKMPVLLVFVRRRTVFVRLYSLKISLF